MSNHEIEDVLSSIRRLVSEDLRPAARAETRATDAMAAAPEVSDKLLLTPALRVVPPEAETAAKTAAEAVTPTVTETDPVPVEEVVSRLGAAVAEEEWESPFGDPEVWRGNTVHDDMPTFVHRDRQSNDTAPDFTEAPMAAFVEVDDVLPDAEPVLSAAPEREPLRKVAPPNSDNWADQAEAEVIADLANAAEDEVLSRMPPSAEGMLFDEEVLRDLVRDLIREELAGTLGERITRNVRKLVRAEIARALALRDFE